MKNLYIAAIGLALSFTGSAYALELDNTVLYGMQASTSTATVSDVKITSDAAASLTQHIFWEDSPIMAKNAVTFYKNSTVVDIHLLWSLVNEGGVKVGLGMGAYLEQGKGLEPTENTSGLDAIVGVVYALPGTDIAITVDYTQRVVGRLDTVSKHTQSSIGVAKDF